MKTYDVVIIGAGPTGLQAAYELSKEGKDVVLLEKLKSLDNLKRACSQQFILDDDYEGEGIIVNDKEGELFFPKSNFSVPYKGKLVPLYNKYYHSPKNYIMRFSTDNGKVPFSYKFDKIELLKGLKNQCEKVEFVWDTRVIDFKDHGNYVTVNAMINNEHVEYKAKKLIDAEGVNSNVCRRSKFNQERAHLTTAYSIKLIVKGIKNVEPYSWNLYYGQAYHSNAAVIIGPSLFGNDIFEITISGDKQKNPMDIWKGFKSDSPMSKNLGNIEIIDILSCTVNAFTPMKNPCKDNVVIAGDTAAFIEVECQGAILCGHHAAKAVMKELSNEYGWSDYNNWWNDSFEFNGDDYFQVAQGYAIVPKYNDDEIDYLFKLASEETMLGTYSQYKTPKYMWKNILKHKDKIEKERPEIYEKITSSNSFDITASFAKTND